MTESPSNDRPILDEAKRKAIIALAGSAVAAAVSFGAITPALADQINTTVAGLLGVVVTVLPMVTSLLHALGIVRSAEPRTTPVDSPSDQDGNPLVPLPNLDGRPPVMADSIDADGDDEGGAAPGDKAEREPPEGGSGSHRAQ